MVHRLVITLLAEESSKELFFELSKKFEIVPFKNSGKNLFISGDFDHIGHMFLMNLNLDSCSNSEIAKSIDALPIKHFGFALIDVTNNHIALYTSNIKRESQEKSPYRKSPEDL